MKTTPSVKVNYEVIADSYDARYTLPADQEPRGQALIELAARIHAQRILEVGCGTGHWLSGLVPTGAQLTGLDLSLGMLNQTRKRQQCIRVVQASATALPLRTEAFDLIYCVDAIHQFEDKEQFLREAYRLLRPGGSLAVMGSDPHRGDVVWFAYDFFEGIREQDLLRFVSHSQLQSWMTLIGFTGIESRQVDVIGEPRFGREILNDLFLQKKSSSQLALLSEENYHAGVEKIKAAIAAAEARGETVIFKSTWPARMITAVKSPAGEQPDLADGVN